MKLTWLMLIAACGSTPEPAVEAEGAGAEAQGVEAEAEAGAEAEAEGEASAEASAEAEAGAEAEPGAEAEAEAGGATGSQAVPAGAEYVPVPGSLRLVVVHDAELLGSETRRIAQISRRLGRGRTFADDAPTEEEARVAKGWIDGSERRIPERWASDETVVALHVAAPETLRSGRRVSKGLRGVAVFRPDADAPFFEARVDPQSAWGFGDRTGDWIADLVDAVGGER